MTLRKNVFYTGLCAAALVTALAAAPAMAETRAGTTTTTSTGVNAKVGGIGVNTNTGLSIGAEGRTDGAGQMNDEIGTQTYQRTRVSTAADSKLDTNKNGFIDESETNLSVNARNDVNVTRARDIGNMGIRAHNSSDNRVGASYGND